MSENIRLGLSPSEYLPTPDTFWGLLNEENAIFLTTIAATYVSFKFLPHPIGAWTGSVISILGASYLFFDEIKKVGTVVYEFFYGTPSNTDPAWEGFRDPTIRRRNPPPMASEDSRLDLSVSYIAVSPPPEPVGTYHAPMDDFTHVFQIPAESPESSTLDLLSNLTESEYAN